MPIFKSLAVVSGPQICGMMHFHLHFKFNVQSMVERYWAQQPRIAFHFPPITFSGLHRFINVLSGGVECHQNALWWSALEKTRPITTDVLLTNFDLNRISAQNNHKFIQTVRAFLIHRLSVNKNRYHTSYYLTLQYPLRNTWTKYIYRNC